MGKWKWLDSHRRLSAIVGFTMLVAGGLATIQGIWNLGTNEPLFPYVAKNIPAWPRIAMLIVFILIVIVGFILVVKIFRNGAPALKQIAIDTDMNPQMLPQKIVHNTRLEHDGVLWEDGGLDSLGHVVVKGPLCKKDLTPLAFRYRLKGSDKPDKLRTDINDSLVIFVGQAVCSQLICLECKAEYTLDAQPKRLGKSRSEAGMRFEGMRRRQ